MGGRVWRRGREGGRDGRDGGLGGPIEERVKGRRMETVEWIGEGLIGQWVKMGGDSSEAESWINRA